MTLRRLNRPFPLKIVARQEEDDDDDDSDDDIDSPASPSPTESRFPTTITLLPPTVSATTTGTSALTFPTPESGLEGVTATTSETESSKPWVFHATATGNSPVPSISVVEEYPTVPSVSADGAQGEGFIGSEVTHENQEMSPAIRGILITFSTLGGLSLLIMCFICFRRRKRNKPSLSEKRTIRMFFPPLRKKPVASSATSPSSPSLEEIIARPLSAHVPTYRITRAQDESSGWKNGWTAKAYERDEKSTINEKSRDTVVSSSDGKTLVDDSTRESVNPFEDPQRNKSYDMIHNRPRSTTLTDTGDWLKNPFEDPRDERFDPFGTLRDRAKEERKRYIALLRAEREKHKQDRLAIEAETNVGGRARASDISETSIR